MDGDMDARKTHHVTSVPYGIDKKTPRFAQGLDFLGLFKQKPRKAEETKRENLETPGSKFLL